jgi:hypothetical protein
MEGFGPQDIQRILAVTDRMKIHRMAVRIPLAPAGAGAVRLTDGKIEIVPPATGDFEEWLAGLPEEIGELDLSLVQRTP